MDRPLKPSQKDSTMIKKAAGVPGIDKPRLQEIAASAKRDCPLSKALASVAEISLQVTLDHGAA
jgi:osmotically inducible protein OsmC